MMSVQTSCLASVCDVVADNSKVSGHAQRTDSSSCRAVSDTFSKNSLSFRDAHYPSFETHVNKSDGAVHTFMQSSGTRGATHQYCECSRYFYGSRNRKHAITKVRERNENFHENGNSTSESVKRQNIEHDQSKIMSTADDYHNQHEASFHTNFGVFDLSCPSSSDSGTVHREHNSLDAQTGNSNILPTANGEVSDKVTVVGTNSVTVAVENIAVHCGLASAVQNIALDTGGPLCLGELLVAGDGIHVPAHKPEIVVVDTQFDTNEHSYKPVQVYDDKKVDGNKRHSKKCNVRGNERDVSGLCKTERHRYSEGFRQDRDNHYGKEREVNRQPMQLYCPGALGRNCGTDRSHDKERESLNKSGKACSAKTGEKNVHAESKKNTKVNTSEIRNDSSMTCLRDHGSKLCDKKFEDFTYSENKHLVQGERGDAAIHEQSLFNCCHHDLCDRSSLNEMTIDTKSVIKDTVNGELCDDTKLVNDNLACSIDGQLMQDYSNIQQTASKRYNDPRNNGSGQSDMPSEMKKTFESNERIRLCVDAGRKDCAGGLVEQVDHDHVAPKKYSSLKHSSYEPRKKSSQQRRMPIEIQRNIEWNTNVKQSVVTHLVSNHTQSTDSQLVLHIDKRSSSKLYCSDQTEGKRVNSIETKTNRKTNTSDELGNRSNRVQESRKHPVSSKLEHDRNNQPSLQTNGILEACSSLTDGQCERPVAFLRTKNDCVKSESLKSECSKTSLVNKKKHKKKKETLTKKNESFEKQNMNEETRRQEVLAKSKVKMVSKWNETKQAVKKTDASSAKVSGHASPSTINAWKLFRAQCISEANSAICPVTVVTEKDCQQVGTRMVPVLSSVISPTGEVIASRLVISNDTVAVDQNNNCSVLLSVDPAANDVVYQDVDCLVDDVFMDKEIDTVDSSSVHVASDTVSADEVKSAPLPVTFTATNGEASSLLLIENNVRSQDYFNSALSSIVPVNSIKSVLSLAIFRDAAISVVRDAIPVVYRGPNRSECDTCNLQQSCGDSISTTKSRSEHPGVKNIQDQNIQESNMQSVVGRGRFECKESNGYLHVTKGLISDDRFRSCTTGYVGLNNQQDMNGSRGRRSTFERSNKSVLTHKNIGNPSQSAGRSPEYPGFSRHYDRYLPPRMQSGNRWQQQELHNQSESGSVNFNFHSWSNNLNSRPRSGYQDALSSRMRATVADEVSVAMKPDPFDQAIVTIASSGFQKEIFPVSGHDGAELYPGYPTSREDVANATANVYGNKALHNLSAEGLALQPMVELLDGMSTVGEELQQQCNLKTNRNCYSIQASQSLVYFRPSSPWHPVDHRGQNLHADPCWSPHLFTVPPPPLRYSAALPFCRPTHYSVANNSGQWCSTLAQQQFCGHQGNQLRPIFLPPPCVFPPSPTVFNHSVPLAVRTQSLSYSGTSPVVSMPDFNPAGIASQFLAVCEQQRPSSHCEENLQSSSSSLPPYLNIPILNLAFSRELREIVSSLSKHEGSNELLPPDYDPAIISYQSDSLDTTSEKTKLLSSSAENISPVLSRLPPGLFQHSTSMAAYLPSVLTTSESSAICEQQSVMRQQLGSVNKKQNTANDKKSTAIETPRIAYEQGAADEQSDTVGVAKIDHGGVNNQQSGTCENRPWNAEINRLSTENKERTAKLQGAVAKQQNTTNDEQSTANKTVCFEFEESSTVGLVANIEQSATSETESRDAKMNQLGSETKAQSVENIPKTLVCKQQDQNDQQITLKQSLANEEYSTACEKPSGSISNEQSVVTSAFPLPAVFDHPLSPSFCLIYSTERTDTVSPQSHSSIFDHTDNLLHSSKTSKQQLSLPPRLYLPPSPPMVSSPPSPPPFLNHPAFRSAPSPSFSHSTGSPSSSPSDLFCPLAGICDCHPILCKPEEPEDVDSSIVPGWRRYIYKPPSPPLNSPFAMTTLPNSPSAPQFQRPLRPCRPSLNVRAPLVPNVFHSPRPCNIQAVPFPSHATLSFPSHTIAPHPEHAVAQSSAHSFAQLPADSVAQFPPHPTAQSLNTKELLTASQSVSKKNLFIERPDEELLTAWRFKLSEAKKSTAGREGDEGGHEHELNGRETVGEEREVRVGGSTRTKDFDGTEITQNLTSCSLEDILDKSMEDATTGVNESKDKNDEIEQKIEADIKNTTGQYEPSTSRPDSADQRCQNFCAALSPSLSNEAAVTEDVNVLVNQRLSDVVADENTTVSSSDIIPVSRHSSFGEQFVDKFHDVFTSSMSDSCLDDRETEVFKLLNHICAGSQHDTGINDQSSQVVSCLAPDSLVKSDRVYDIGAEEESETWQSSVKSTNEMNGESMQPPNIDSGASLEATSTVAAFLHVPSRDSFASTHVVSETFQLEEAVLGAVGGIEIDDVFSGKLSPPEKLVAEDLLDFAIIETDEVVRGRQSPDLGIDDVIGENVLLDEIYSGDRQCLKALEEWRVAQGWQSPRFDERVLGDSDKIRENDTPAMSSAKLGFTMDCMPKENDSISSDSCHEDDRQWRSSRAGETDCERAENSRLASFQNSRGGLHESSKQEEACLPHHNGWDNGPEDFGQYGRGGTSEFRSSLAADGNRTAEVGVAEPDWRQLGARPRVPQQHNPRRGDDGSPQEKFRKPFPHNSGKSFGFLPPTARGSASNWQSHRGNGRGRGADYAARRNDENHEQESRATVSFPSPQVEEEEMWDVHAIPGERVTPWVVPSSHYSTRRRRAHAHVELVRTLCTDPETGEQEWLWLPANQANPLAPDMGGGAGGGTGAGRGGASGSAAASAGAGARHTSAAQRPSR